MVTAAIALGSMVLYVAAYHTYGRYLARRVFRVDASRVAPSVEREDGVDFVPSHRDVVFGHHFTSIAGTGPIVGPAIAVIWGWVPALVWVLVGSIAMGAVHDFGALVISMRHRGRTIADLAGGVVSPRVRVLFMVVVVVGLWIVLAVFGLVIANIFRSFPQSVWPSFLQIPIAVGLGVYVRRGGSLRAGSAAAVVLMYATITAAAWAASRPEGGVWAQVLRGELTSGLTAVISPSAFWTLVLLAYVFIASVLPVQTLLQPRDYINALQLLLAMGLLVVGVLAAHPPLAGYAVNTAPKGAPPMMPFLFITVACGAISGFHCLVASGCSSRQLRSESDAQYVGYGAMLAEGFLAVLVILACSAGFGMTGPGGTTVGAEGWRAYYAEWKEGLSFTLNPVVLGAGNMIERVGIPGTVLYIPHSFAVAMMGVFIASFAATTLDTAARLQRYVISELGVSAGIRALGNRYVATGVAVSSAGALALWDVTTKGWSGGGSGGLLLWPIFGATNQLLGGLALLVVTVWLVRTRRPAWVTAVPMAFMLLMTGWAVSSLIGKFSSSPGQELLTVVACLMLGLESWIVVEAANLVFRGRVAVEAEPTSG
jgi:carbon starvation protein